jgi:hypothetical protein
MTEKEDARGRALAGTELMMIPVAEGSTCIKPV